MPGWVLAVVLCWGTKGDRNDHCKIVKLSAHRAAKELKDGRVVNLGYGMPGLCANFNPEGGAVFFQGENGTLEYRPLLTDEEKDDE